MARIGVGVDDVALQEPKPFVATKAAPYPRQENFTPVLLPKGPAIVGAVIGGTIATIRQAVEAEKAALNDLGPEGLTPLQVAVRNNRHDVVKVLLELGADVDTKGAKNRTAMLIACQIGNVSVVNMLFESNCDMSAVDEDGRGCMHYAAVAPSPLVIHYLQYVADMTLLVLDKHKSTPLHIAARHPKFSETLDYLVEQNVYNVLDRDNTGSTSLHYAAQAGNRENCFKLVVASGNRRSELMATEDKNGNTAMLLLQKIKKTQSRQLAVELRSWGRFGMKHAWLHWMVHLTFTPVSMTLIILAMTYLPEYISFFIAILAPVIFFRAFRNLTRINHVSRWPSPLMLGTYLTGIVHSIVCFIVRVNPVFMKYDGWSIGMFFNWAVVITVVMVTWRILRQDPGICKDSSLKKDGTPYGLEDVAADVTTDAVAQLKFCVRCGIVPPAVTKHCRLCNVCVENFDHHCVWLNRCIGYLNMRLFVFLLMTLIVTNLTFVIGAYRFLYLKRYSMGTFPALFELVSSKEPWLCWLIGLNALCVMVAFMSLTEKLVVISKGCTSYFDKNGQRYTGYGNLLQELSGRKPSKISPISRGAKLHNLLTFLTTAPKPHMRKPIMAT